MVFNNQGGAFSIFGPEKVISGTRLRDGFSCSVGSYFRDAGRIKRFYLDQNGNEATEELCSGITGNRIAWAEFNGEVFFSDGIVNRKIVNNVVVPWGVQVPQAAPLLSGSSVLGAGQVMACYSYLLDDGSESGTSPVAISSYGRVVSNIKRSDDPRVAAVKVYLTGPDNSTFYHAATILNGTPSVEVTVDYRNGEEAVTRGKVPPPPGSLITSHSGSMFIASGNVVYFTDPYSLDLVSIGETISDNPVVNIWQFVGEITLMESVTDGMYVGSSDGTYWLSGTDPYNMQPVPVEESVPEIGAVRRLQEDSVIWKSDAGFIRGGTGGKVERMNFDNVSMDNSIEGVTALGSMDLNGTQAVIGVPQRPEPGKLRNKEWKPDFINDTCET
ncbi:MAG: hypothetical protein GWO10_09785 [candidate division Zixibacteria bacterium]|nr:hypothetical protein [Gammaproteobacteria bacterium]NIR64043.1 hypothetical protein [candidate division Zixibacteria bacterium]NIW40512.1 hypothetical protein [candidate division Zixibacteria bacterium]